MVGLGTGSAAWLSKSLVAILHKQYEYSVVEKVRIESISHDLAWGLVLGSSEKVRKIHLIVIVVAGAVPQRTISTMDVMIEKTVQFPLDTGSLAQHTSILDEATPLLSTFVGVNCPGSGLVSESLKTFQHGFEFQIIRQ